MATIYQRKSKDGKRVLGWKAVVRIEGHPTVCKISDRKKVVEDWAKDIELQIKEGSFNFSRQKQKHTLGDLIERYISSGALEHHRAAKDTLRHLQYWKIHLDDYSLTNLTPELLEKERQALIDTPFRKEKKRTSATVNRYIASLSGALTYACRQLRWIDENPCFNLIKLKEFKGRDRTLTEDEIQRLLKECRQSQNPYLYCIVLIGLTTGARRGEILGLTWDQIDFENKIAHIKETKNGTARSIPLVDSVVQELKEIFNFRNPAKPLVFASKTAFGKIDITKSWNKALKHANIHNFVFHGMRHQFATVAASSGASNMQLKTAMGHKTLQMLERYTHLDAQTTRHLSNTASQQILGQAHA